jgi:hypothetical protein
MLYVDTAIRPLRGSTPYQSPLIPTRTLPLVQHNMHPTKVSRAIFLFLISTVMYAATLKPQSVQAWDRYLAAAEANLVKHTQEKATFLWVDESADRRQRARDGEIIVAETYLPNKKVPDALIHDWTGAAFIRGARIEDVIAIIRNYDHYKDYYSPTVIRSKTIEQSAARDRFSVVMVNQSLLVRTAVETDCQAAYTQVSDKRSYAVSKATRIQEIEDYGHAGEHRLPVGEGGGFLWRLATITRFEERDGGVYLEVEALALSRDVPFSLRFVVDPIVRRVSRNSLTESLKQTDQAVAESIAGALAILAATR